MFFKKNRFIKKPAKAVIISIAVLFIMCVGYYVLGYMGIIYMKSDEAQKAYEFIDDMNSDGKKENVKFVNHYYSYYKKNTCDAEYTLNKIKLYLDGKAVYSNDISTLGPLLNPKIIDLVEKNSIQKQIFVHADGGGPAIPMDYFFYIKDGKVVLSAIESGH